ncbi:MAG: hypothetical protein OEV81_06265 [Betaproteobacteria bacterium]|nr:hypothetical protein [Betaproteobacteria bacterium]MDH5220499.1 hypothetical protein [Betaproteobacteria bacterium]MDH5351363.1 hypothetical protein [Betaproteobacteria bacterium]
MRRLAPAALAALLAGCATTYGLTLMPRDSGEQYFGEAVSSGSDEAEVTIAIGERTFKGTWVVSRPPPTTGIAIGGGFGTYGRRMGTTVVVDAQAGTDAKALLRAADGSGLRCDFRGVHGAGAGSGTCQDDRGLTYDVQIRAK